MDKNMKLWTNILSLLMNIHKHSSEPRSEPRKCGQYWTHSSEPRKCGQYCPNLKNNCPHFLDSLECSWMFISRLEMFVHNFMFLSIFSRKLYEHLNMFIRIGYVSWHLLNLFLSIFVTILLFFISTNQNHFKIKKTKLYYFQSQSKSTKPSEKY